jgi:preprotein translocase subunit YajC
MLGASGGSGSAGFFLLLIVAFAFLYFVLVRPQKRRQVESQRMLSSVKVGDEVVTAGGIYGRVTSIGDDDELMVEIAPNLEVRVARRAIGGIVNRTEEEPEDAEEPEPDSSGEPPPEA